MSLPELWFGIIAVLFLGFFILEGFDFGVGMLMEPIARMGRIRRRTGRESTALARTGCSGRGRASSSIPAATS